MTLRPVGIGVTFGACDRMTSEVLAFGVALRHAMHSRLSMRSIVDTAIENELFGDAARPTSTLKALAAYVLDLLSLRRLHVKTW